MEMIGILDSGLGGLRVARAISENLPEYDMVYFGDTARATYGTLSPARITEYGLENVKFLVDRGARVIIVSSHAISSAALPALRDSLDLSLFDIISPAVAFALKVTRFQRIGVIGSHAVIDSGVYEKKIHAINPDSKVYSSSSQLLAPMIQEGWLKRPETNMIVKKYLHGLKVRRIDTLIPACGHYFLLMKTLSRKAGKQVQVIDPGLVLAQELTSRLGRESDSNASPAGPGVRKFYLSDITSHTEKSAAMIFGKRISLEPFHSTIKYFKKG